MCSDRQPPAFVPADHRRLLRARSRDFCSRVREMSASESRIFLDFCLFVCCVQVFGRRSRVDIPALGQPAAEKRQGTKSREVGRWLAASAMGIRCERRGRLGVGGRHDVACVSGATGGDENAVGISIGVWGASPGGRRIDRRCWVERDRGRRGASVSERDSRNDHRVSGS
jgi:hypothetical protein